MTKLVRENINNDEYIPNDWWIWHIIEIEKDKEDFKNQFYHIEYGSYDWHRLQDYNKEIEEAKKQHLNEKDLEILATLWWHKQTKTHSENFTPLVIKKAEREVNKLFKKYPNLK
jgi:hypothetical protein